MKTRRGSSLWPTTLSGATMVNQYKPGDIVSSSLTKEADFIGVVRAVDPKINKVWVAWAGGAVSQHDPDEIHFEPHQSDLVRSRMASRRNLGKTAKKEALVAVDQTDFLSPEMEQLLNEQVSFEMYSAYMYFMVAAWCQSKGLVGFQSWFERQGNDEVEHAMKVYKHLVDTGSSLTLPAIPSPSEELELEIVEDATEAVLNHEKEVTKRWQIIGEVAKKSPNLATQELAQWFMTEQVEEEDGAVTLHQKVEMAGGDGAAILIIDHELKCLDPNEAVKTASDKKAETTGAGPQFVGDPAEHGIDKPLGGGFSIMQNLVKQQHTESMEEADKAQGTPKTAAGFLRHKENRPLTPKELKFIKDAAKLMNLAWQSIAARPANSEILLKAMEDGKSAEEAIEEYRKGKIASLRSRRAMYWSNPERVYRRTRREITDDTSICPKCKEQMELQPYTKSDRMWSCQCGFKIPRSNVVAGKS